ncbi:hypothetical protein LIER_40555 [Lithospermum erythrorhizon]|uniref:Transposase n=1 Tax=Lithospermum erythrorhizon TaxID=34254 RepID=A0AAV3QZN5_LITER
MSSHHVDLTSDHSDSQNYARDTPVDQGLVDESQTATSAEISLQEGIEAACEMIHTATTGLAQKKKKKKRSLVLGVKFPSPSEATPSVLASGSKGKEKEALNRAPGQVHPLGWLYITVFHVICGIVRVKPNIPLFCQLFTVTHTGVTTSLSPAKRWNIFVDDKPRKVAETRWHPLWFLLKEGMYSRVPKRWINVKNADRPKAEPTQETSAALVKLKAFFLEKMHWKTFCEEGVLIAVDLVHDQEFDTSGNPIPWVGILLAANDTFLPNAVPLERMRGKRPIAFKKLKVVKKGVVSPGPSAGVTPAQHSSPIAVGPVSSLQPEITRYA